MFELVTMDHLLPNLPVLDIKVGDIRIDIEPSAIPLLPHIRIDANIDIHFAL